MPYTSLVQLPVAVHRHLPLHAQEIYRAAFNNAWITYAARGDQRERIAHQVAWAAVKKHYVKKGDNWIARA